MHHVGMCMLPGEQWERNKMEPASRIDGVKLVKHWEEAHSRTCSGNIIFKDDSFISCTSYIIVYLTGTK